MELLSVGYKNLIDRVKRIGNTPLMCVSICGDEDNLCRFKEWMSSYGFWAFLSIGPLVAYLFMRWIRKKEPSFWRFILSLLYFYPIYFLVVLLVAYAMQLSSWIALFFYVVYVAFILIGLGAPWFLIVYGIIYLCKNKKRCCPKSLWIWFFLSLLTFLAVAFTGLIHDYC